MDLMTDEKAAEDAVSADRPYPSKPRFEDSAGGPIAEVGFARSDAEPTPEPTPEPTAIMPVEPAAITPAPPPRPPEILPLEIDYSKYAPRNYNRIDPNVKLRSVQGEAVDAFFEEQKLRRTIIALPTGCGKSVMALTIAGRINGRVLWIAHRDELIEQPAAEIDKRFPGLEYGIEKGGVRTGVGKRVVIASIQTLAKLNRLKAVMSGAPFALVVFDEAHHAPAKMPRRVLAQLGCLRTDGKGPLLLGLTATIERADKTSLSEVFDDVIYSVSMREAIDLGYLVPPKPIKVYLPINPKALRVVNGDFAVGDLERELTRTNAAQATATAILANCGPRKTLVFCSSVNQAQRTADACNELGIKAAWVSGEPHMNKTDRRAKLHQFSIGEIQVLLCSDLLVEGYDERSISAVVIAKPTKSQSRYIQQVGRGLRTCEHKIDCLVIDIVGASDLGLVTAEILVKQDKKELKKRPKREIAPDSSIEWQKLTAYLRSASVDLIEHGELTFARASVDMIVTVAKDRELVILRRVSTDPEDLWQIEHRGVVFSPMPLSLQETMSVCDTLIEEFGGGAKPGSPEWDVATSAPAPPKGFNPVEDAKAEATRIVQPEGRLPIAFARAAGEGQAPGMTAEDLAERIDNDMLNSEAAAFAKGIRMAFRDKKIHLLDVDRGPPHEPHRWGWVPLKRPLIFGNDVPFEPEGAMVGWVRGDAAYIDAEVCVPLAKTYLMSVGESCDIRITHMRRHLGTKKVLFKGEEKHWLKIRARDIDHLIGDHDARHKKSEFIAACRKNVEQSKTWKPTDSVLLFTERVLGVKEEPEESQAEDEA